MRKILGLILTVSCMQGCTTSGPAVGPSAGWIKQQGGLISDTTADRPNAVAGRFVGVVTRPIQVHVLKNSSPTAYAWPSGDIFVTSRLVAILSDDELAAVIAHEMGHIITDAHSGSALTGSHEHTHAEMQADDAGLRLMAASSTPQTALRSALHKVLSFHQLQGNPSPSLAERISRLP